ncbi:MAG: SHOCT domain-containing protein [Actinomycetota bacterium]|nr:SHOCT domain-containing protein [Actinomycetota bacterium]
MPLLDVFWSMMWMFLFIAWIWVLIGVLGDVFRSDDMSGVAKAFWVLFIILLPWLGVLVYFIARGDSMAGRSMQAAADADAATRSYIQDAAGSSPAAELAKLAELRDSGALTEAEFAAQKAKVLG